jgi:hypothetical protein
MIISEAVWCAAYDKIEEFREDKLKRLLSGNCEDKEYAKICGLLEGLELFETLLKEARAPRKVKEDAVSD